MTDIEALVLKRAAEMREEHDVLVSKFRHEGAGYMPADVMGTEQEVVYIAYALSELRAQDPEMVDQICQDLAAVTIYRELEESRGRLDNRH